MKKKEDLMKSKLLIVLLFALVVLFVSGCGPHPGAVGKDHNPLKGDIDIHYATVG